jgi:uncharacterized protein (DUF1330 family)
MYKVQMGPDIAAYLERIDATLLPYGGRFLVHGDPVEVIEGDWPGHLIIIAFPDRARAKAWYGSGPYQAIVRLRTENSESDVVFVDGVSADHRAADLVAARPV